MSDSEVSARLLDAMAAAVAGDVRAALVSVTIDVLQQGAIARVDATIVRRTRTLAFMTAEAIGAAGERVASANAVYKLIA